MSKYIDAITYFTNLAIADTILKHAIDEGAGLRNAFISISDEEELMASLINNLTDKFAVQVGFNGSTSNSDGGISSNHTHSLRFYAKALDYTYAEEGKEAAFDAAYNIARHWQQKIMNDSVSGNGCGAFAYIELGSFVITKLPPLYNSHFGFQLTFTEQVEDVSYLLPDNNYWN